MIKFDQFSESEQVGLGEKWQDWYALLENALEKGQPISKEREDAVLTLIEHYTLRETILKYHARFFKDKEWPALTEIFRSQLDTESFATFTDALEYFYDTNTRLSEKEYDYLLNRYSGICIPGGATHFIQNTGELLINLATQRSDGWPELKEMLKLNVAQGMQPNGPRKLYPLYIQKVESKKPGFSLFDDEEDLGSMMGIFDSFETFGNKHQISEARKKWITFEELIQLLKPHYRYVKTKIISTRTSISLEGRKSTLDTQELKDILGRFTTNFKIAGANIKLPPMPAIEKEKRQLKKDYRHSDDVNDQAEVAALVEFFIKYRCADIEKILKEILMNDRHATPHWEEIFEFPNDTFKYAANRGVKLSSPKAELDALVQNIYGGTSGEVLDRYWTNLYKNKTWPAFEQALRDRRKAGNLQLGYWDDGSEYTTGGVIKARDTFLNKYMRMKNYTDEELHQIFIEHMFEDIDELPSPYKLKYIEDMPKPDLFFEDKISKHTVDMWTDLSDSIDAIIAYSRNDAKFKPNLQNTILKWVLYKKSSVHFKAYEPADLNKLISIQSRLDDSMWQRILAEINEVPANRKWYTQNVKSKQPGFQVMDDEDDLGDMMDIF